ncbi:hypothetical protein QW060_09975 [Myroides ceti]|uniref:ATP synthase F0 subunit 8 n=1 Tax=Paenimyroides ceti TaxID=395087 RepID=A0ABT8CV72_9FLAO|nr:hypothetical protein [Paenimyroides ceti]MDN3707457.1 hypothetical protein [Paenimyroides ceti]
MIKKNLFLNINPFIVDKPWLYVFITLTISALFVVFISRKHIPQNPPIKRVLQLTLKSLMFRIYREQYQFYFIVRI